MTVEILIVVVCLLAFVCIALSLWLIESNIDNRWLQSMLATALEENNRLTDAAEPSQMVHK